MFVFREIWRALFSCKIRFEIRRFGLLLMIQALSIRVPLLKI